MVLCAQRLCLFCGKTLSVRENQNSSRKAPVPTEVGLRWTCELPKCADVESITYGKLTWTHKGAKKRKGEVLPLFFTLGFGLATALYLCW